jgi:hypothetical protein
MSIANEIAKVLNFPSGLKNVGVGYVMSLMQDQGRRTLQSASDGSGLNPSQFSRFLSMHKDLGLKSLNRLARRRLNRVLSKRQHLVNGARFQSIWNLFNRTRKIGPWQTIRHRAGGRKKRRESQIRTLTGFLKGVAQCEVRLVAVEKPNGERLFLACSRVKTSPGAIARAYRARWSVELFHRSVKSHLGFEDAGLMKFEAMHAHVVWVYCAYLLLYELVDEESSGVLDRRRKVERRIKDKEVGRILKANAGFDSNRAVRTHCLQVREALRAA